MRTLSPVQILALIYNLGIVQMWNVSFPRGNISKCWLRLLLVNTLVKWLELIWQKKIAACQNQLNSLSSTGSATGQFCPFCCIVPFNLCPWSPVFVTYINQIQNNIWMCGTVWHVNLTKSHTPIRWFDYLHTTVSYFVLLLFCVPGISWNLLPLNLCRS